MDDDILQAILNTYSRILREITDIKRMVKEKTADGATNQWLVCNYEEGAGAESRAERRLTCENTGVVNSLAQRDIMKVIHEKNIITEKAIKAHQPCKDEYIQQKNTADVFIKQSESKHDEEKGNTLTGNTLTGNTQTKNTQIGNTQTRNTQISNTLTGNTLTGNTQISNTLTRNTQISNTLTRNTQTASQVVKKYKSTTTFNPGLGAEIDRCYSQGDRSVLSSQGTPFLCKPKKSKIQEIYDPEKWKGDDAKLAFFGVLQKEVEEAL